MTLSGTGLRPEVQDWSQKGSAQGLWVQYYRKQIFSLFLWTSNYTNGNRRCGLSPEDLEDEVITEKEELRIGS